jgi:hypothetical protein
MNLSDSFSLNPPRRVLYLFLLLCNPFIRFANKINWRLGRPYRGAQWSPDTVTGMLHPGMVILSHKNYELTNWFIRGHWTHAAIYIGEHTVIEAVSKGVVKNSLATFLKMVDDFMILRPTFCDPHTMTEAAEIVKKIVGYPYNFTFRSRKESFYCSELVYRAYSQTSRWKYVEKEYPGKLWDFHSTEIVIPQNLLESSHLWQVVDHRS